MKRLTDLAKEWMKDPEFRSEYERSKREFEIVDALIRARAAAKLTQAEIAERMGTTQSAVARLEGGRGSPSIATLRKYAEATGTELKIAFVRPRAA
jgi:transcriptional regulator with XRE-family HTH domain